MNTRFYMQYTLTILFIFLRVINSLIAVETQ